MESMPTLIHTHSSASTLPVLKAILGMLSTVVYSCCFRGKRVRQAPVLEAVQVMALFWQAVTAGMVNWRRKRPSCRTTGKATPTGTSLSWNVPSTLLVVATSGLPETSAVQLLALTQMGALLAELLTKSETGPLGT